LRVKEGEAMPETEGGATDASSSGMAGCIKTDKPKSGDCLEQFVSHCMKWLAELPWHMPSEEAGLAALLWE
jgi:hypothetical protein